MDRRLTRDTKHGVLGGVAAGFAKYFDVDPVLARIVFIALAALSGAGVLAYIVGWIIMPRDDRAAEAAAPAPAAARTSSVDRVVEKVREAGDRLADELHRLPERGDRGRVVAGSILIALGALFFLDRFPWWHWPRWARLANLWPLILIAVGVSLILEAARGRRGGGT